jgi:putative hydrolase of the HAD superfamily
MGGVLLTNGWDRASRRAAVEKFHLDADDFEDRHELLLNAFETGNASLDEYLNRTVFYRDRTFTKADFEEFFFAQSRELPETIEVLRELVRNSGCFMAALNNESLELNNYRIRQFRLRDYFSAFFSSCYLGCRKPDPKIYRLALDITQCRPEECIFVDDRPLNLECARELGMRAIHFVDARRLRADLRNEGVRLGA